MFYLENNIDLCDTPLQDILRFVEVNLAFKGVDLDLLRRKILRQKNLIKRNRAKNRKNVPNIKKPYEVVVSLPDEDEEETKKQRNRISAQISRDKKKLRVRELEEMNKRLQEECNLQKLENDQLKQSMLTKPKRYMLLTQRSLHQQDQQDAHLPRYHLPLRHHQGPLLLQRTLHSHLQNRTVARSPRPQKRTRLPRPL
jgi:hypothetical protein